MAHARRDKTRLRRYRRSATRPPSRAVRLCTFRQLLCSRPVRRPVLPWIRTASPMISSADPAWRRSAFCAAAAVICVAPPSRAVIAKPGTTCVIFAIPCDTVCALEQQEPTFCEAVQYQRTVAALQQA
ncbi:hypothetical protein KCP77_03800 [Salmonella enterica subsp. enterica]|nr:hypothetical protein KCP77_03800 [Salmonella enterica subsp. enterica]